MAGLLASVSTSPTDLPRTAPSGPVLRLNSSGGTPQGPSTRRLQWRGPRRHQTGFPNTTASAPYQHRLRSGVRRPRSRHFPRAVDALHVVQRWSSDRNPALHGAGAVQLWGGEVESQCIPDQRTTRECIPDQRSPGPRRPVPRSPPSVAGGRWRVDQTPSHRGPGVPRFAARPHRRCHDLRRRHGARDQAGQPATARVAQHRRSPAAGPGRCDRADGPAALLDPRARPQHHGLAADRPARGPRTRFAVT